MAITYKWDIPQMNAHIQAEGEDNVIYTVHWRYTCLLYTSPSPRD